MGLQNVNADYSFKSSGKISTIRFLYNKKYDNNNRSAIMTALMPLHTYKASE